MGRVKAFKKVISDNQDIRKLSDNLIEFLVPVQKNNLLDGLLLKSIALASGTTSVEHKLGRAPEGWIVVRNRAQSTIWDTQDANSMPEKTLILHSSAATTVDLWVF